jgi:hypothetical protein
VMVEPSMWCYDYGVDDSPQLDLVVDVRLGIRRGASVHLEPGGAGKIGCPDDQD